MRSHIRAKFQWDPAINTRDRIMSHVYGYIELDDKPKMFTVTEPLLGDTLISWNNCFLINVWITVALTERRVFKTIITSWLYMLML